jgi:hypothetical protein
VYWLKGKSFYQPFGGYGLEPLHLPGAGDAGVDAPPEDAGTTRPMTLEEMMRIARERAAASDPAPVDAGPAASDTADAGQ